MPSRTAIFHVAVILRAITALFIFMVPSKIAGVPSSLLVVHALVMLQQHNVGALIERQMSRHILHVPPHRSGVLITTSALIAATLQ